MKYKYIIFDFNGTIIDDVDLCLDLLNQMLVLEGLKTFDVDGYKEIFTFELGLMKFNSHVNLSIGISNCSYVSLSMK